MQRICYLFPHHILTFMTVGLMGGIVVAHIPSDCFWVTGLLVTLLALTWQYAHHPFNNTTISMLLVMLSGLLGYTRYKQQTKSFDQVYQKRTTSLDCRAHVDALEPSSHPKFKWLLTLTTQTVKIKNKWTSNRHTFQIYSCRKPTLYVGDYIELRGLRLVKPNNPDFCNYLKKEKVSATFFIPHSTPVVLYRPPISIARFLACYKETFVRSLQQKLSSETFKLFCTIFLGKKSKYINNNIKQDCKKWGISHYLARSGLHLIFFILLWHFLLNLFQLRSPTKSGVLVLLACSYYLLSWTSISFNRAFFTFLFHQLCTLLLLPAHVAYLLLLVCFGVLAYNPYQLFFLDFQLSFSLACAIAWFHNLSYQRQRHSSSKLS